MNEFLFFAAVVAVSSWIIGCATEKAPIPIKVQSFDECAKAGGVLIKTFPGKCLYNGETFSRKIN